VTFIADHPEILSIANMIHQSKKTSWNKPSIFKELLFTLTSTFLQNQDKEEQTIKESTLEVCAYIFLYKIIHFDKTYKQLI